jgi:hypothetical protein
MTMTLVSGPRYIFCAAFVATTALSLSACQAGGELKFDWGSAPFKVPITPGYSELLLGSELGSVPGTCLSGVQVQYTARNYQRSTETEAVMFAMSPETFEQKLIALSDSSKLTGAWQSLASSPAGIPTPVSLRVALGPEPNSPQPMPALIAPLTSSFWGTGPIDPAQSEVRGCSPFGSSPSGPLVSDASIKAAAVYYHGACGATKDLAGILNEVVEGLWNGFKSSSIDGPQSHYRHAISIIELGNYTDGKQSFGSPSSNVRGGFLFTFHFRGDILSGNNEAWGTYKYMFSLRNGILSITDDDVTQLSLHSSGIWGWKLTDGLGDGASTQVPTKFNQETSTEQETLLPAPAICSTISECDVASAFIAAAITPEKIQALGLPAPTPTDLNRIRCAVGSHSDCEQIGRSINMASIWDCPLFPFLFPGDTAHCKFRLPAKRLLVFPNELELVWFDDADYNNQVFGLFVAGSPDSQAQLCTAIPAVPNGIALRPRNFASVGHLGNQ